MVTVPAARCQGKNIKNIWNNRERISEFNRTTGRVATNGRTVPGRILEWGPGHSTQLAEALPDASILSIEHDPAWHQKMAQALRYPNSPWLKPRFRLAAMARLKSDHTTSNGATAAMLRMPAAPPCVAPQRQRQEQYGRQRQSGLGVRAQVSHALRNGGPSAIAVDPVARRQGPHIFDFDNTVVPGNSSIDSKRLNARR